MESVVVKKLSLTDYQLGETLGTGKLILEKTGSFGRVRIAKNKTTGKFVAMKSMKKYEIMKSKQTDHIMNEVKILGMIDHPFIITFDGFTQDEKFLYLSLELINGGELFTYLRTVGKFPVEQAQ